MKNTVPKGKLLFSAFSYAKTPTIKQITVTNIISQKNKLHSFIF